jgi:hypothetical protein
LSVDDKFKFFDNEKGSLTVQYELIFRGSLIQYWEKIHTELEHLFPNDQPEQASFNISHSLPPGEFDPVIIDILDEEHRLAVVSLMTESGADANIIKLTVFIQRKANEKSGESALLRWNNIKDAWLAQGLLINPLAEPQKTTAKVEKPAKPEKDARLDDWFNWYDEMRANDFVCTLKQIAAETGYSHDRIRLLHARYKNERKLLKT